MAFGKEEVCAYLDSRGVVYDRVDHEAVFTMEAMDALSLPFANVVVKNLFLRDDKKRNYYLVVMPEDKPANLKALRAALGARPLRLPRKRLAGNSRSARWGGLSFRRAERYGRESAGGVGCGFARLAGRGRASQRQHGHAARSSVRLAGAVRRSRRALSVRRHKRGFCAVGRSASAMELRRWSRSYADNGAAQCYASR